MKQRIRLTESQLHQVIKESVKKVLDEKFGYNSQELAYNFAANGEDPYGIGQSNASTLDNFWYKSKDELEADNALRRQRIARSKQGLDPLLIKQIRKGKGRYFSK